MSCPFKNLLTTPSGSKRDRDSRCPFTGATSLSQAPATASGSSSVTAVVQAAEDAHAETASSGLLVPHKDETTHEDLLVGSIPSGPPPTSNVRPVCPYGFSSSSAGVALTPLQCSLCHTFLHATASIDPCTHKFCRFCVMPFRDCPVCGADIVGLREEPELQAQVDRFLEAHCRGMSRDHSDTVACSPQQLPGGTSRSDFYLQLGTQALAGGNMHAAYDRLSKCKTDLEGQLDQLGGALVNVEEGSTSLQRSSDEVQSKAGPVPNAGGKSLPKRSISSTSRLACQLGAVLGLQADCCRRIGDVGRAVALYAQSVDVLTPFAADDPEVAHSLSITNNKRGDLYYYQQDFSGAASAYRTALTLRQGILDSLLLQSKDCHNTSKGQLEDCTEDTRLKAPPSVCTEGPSNSLSFGSPTYVAMLDIASSLIKVVDAELEATTESKDECQDKSRPSSSDSLSEAKVLIESLRPSRFKGNESLEGNHENIKWTSIFNALNQLITRASALGDKKDKD